LHPHAVGVGREGVAQVAAKRGNAGRKDAPASIHFHGYVVGQNPTMLVNPATLIGISAGYLHSPSWYSIEMVGDAPPSDGLTGSSRAPYNGDTPAQLEGVHLEY